VTGLDAPDPNHPAVQRNEKAIERWRAEAARVEAARRNRERRELFFVDEAGFYLLAGWSGPTPGGAHHRSSPRQTADHLSVMGRLTWRGQGLHVGRQESLNGLHAAESWGHLLRMAGERLLADLGWLVVIHRRAEVKAWCPARAGRCGWSAPGLRPGPEPGRVAVAARKHVELPDTGRASTWMRVASGVPPGGRPIRKKRHLHPSFRSPERSWSVRNFRSLRTISKAKALLLHGIYAGGGGPRVVLIPGTSKSHIHRNLVGVGVGEKVRADRPTGVSAIKL